MSYNEFVVGELAAGRCPVAGDSEHRWQLEEPPDHVDTGDWTDDDWDDWYEQAPRHCGRCGITDD